MRRLVQATLRGFVRRFAGAVALSALASLTLASGASALDLGHSFTGSFAGSGTNALGANLAGIAVDSSGGPSDGDVYVADPTNHRIEKFDAAGNFILMFGDNVNATTGGDVCTAASGDTCQPGLAGNNAARLTRPRYLAVDLANGAVYVVDAGETDQSWNADDTIHAFDEDGNLLTDWGSLGRLSGADPQSSFAIEGIATMAGGGFVVYNNAVYPSQFDVYDVDGVLAEAIAEPEGCGNHYQAGGLAANPAGTAFYVLNFWAEAQYGSGKAAESIERIVPGGTCKELTAAPYKHGYQDPVTYELVDGVAEGTVADPVTGTLYLVEQTRVSEWKMNGSGEPVDQFGAPCAEVCAATHSFGDGSLTKGAFVGVSSATNTVYVTDPAEGRVAIFAATPLADATTGPATSNKVVTGEVDPDGAGDVVSCRFEFGTSYPQYGSTAPCDQPTPYSSPKAVTATLEGLISGTTYHYRVVVENAAGGISYGDDETLTPDAVDGLATGAATAVEPTQATLHASFVGNGEATHYYFEWGTDTSYGQRSATPPGTSAGSPSGPSPTQLQYTATGLQPQTTYHYRVVVENPEGIARGADETFTTPPAVTSLTTEAASAVAARSATLNGSFEGNGEATTYHYEYGTDETYGSSTTPVQLSAPSGHTTVPAPITGLQPETTYHFRVVAANGIGTSYGLDQSFTTPPAVGGVVTLAPTEVEQDHITLNAEFDGNGGETHYYFEYGTTTAYGQLSEAAPGSVVAPGATHVSSQITDFLGATTYHYRVVMANSEGVTYGNDVSFESALPPKPTIVASSATPLSPTSAKLEATLNPNRLATVYSFEYGTQQTYGSSTEISQSIGSDTSPHEVSATIGDLLPGITYHYRVVAISFAGTTYGTDGTFTTPSGAAVGGGDTGGSAQSPEPPATTPPPSRPKKCKKNFVKRHGRCVKKHKKHKKQRRHSTRRHG